MTVVKKYDALIAEVTKVKRDGRKKPHDFWLVQHYDVKKVDVLHDAHIKLGQGGRDKMVYELKP